MNAERKIKQAITNLILDQPFFGALALRLRTVANATITETAATDGQILAYNPAFIDTLDLAQVTGLVAHEVLHCANGHAWRRDGRDPKLWNVACDYAINSILKEAGFYLPADGLIDARYTGQPAEAIYGSLKDSQQPQNQPQSGAGNGQAGQNGQTPGQGQQQGQNGQSGAPEPQGWGEVIDNTAPDSASQEVEWQVATLQAAQAAKAQGKLPAGLDRLIDSIKNPAVDWRAALRRFVQETAKADYTWKMPSTRYLAGGLYLPSLQSEQMRPLVVGVDTSGSVSAEELASFGAEIQAIMDECQPESLTVIYCDSQVNGVDEFEPGDVIKLSPKGGGGTRFAPVFDKVEELALEPACLVYLTDLEGPMPTQMPEFPVLWLNTGRRNQSTPFGEVLDFPTERM